MKRLSCWLGRHAWTTRIERGEEFDVCSVCGKEKGGSSGGPRERQREREWQRAHDAGP
jgi:hypothetical protein